MSDMKKQGQKPAIALRAAQSDRTQLPIETFPVIPIGSLAQILDENWFPEYR